MKALKRLGQRYLAMNPRDRIAVAARVMLAGGLVMSVPFTIRLVAEGMRIFVALPLAVLLGVAVWAAILLVAVAIARLAYSVLR